MISSKVPFSLEHILLLVLSYHFAHVHTVLPWLAWSFQRLAENQALD